MKITNKCICGHNAFFHNYPNLSWCSLCVKIRYLKEMDDSNYNAGNPYEHRFQLDNLQLVEEMAQERNLI